MGEAMSKVIWIEGLSGAGKTTLAQALVQRLSASGSCVVNLDGDMLRQGVCRDLGFSDEDRAENLRRAGELAKLLVAQNFIVVASFITPFEKDRDTLRKIIGLDAWLEVYMATPLAVCEARDPKGLYKAAREGRIRGFTGVDARFECPMHADLTLNSQSESLSNCVDAVIAHFGLANWRVESSPVEPTLWSLAY